jgi:hypothetical protein
MQRQGNGLLPLLFLERKANMSDKLNTLEALRLASLKAKGYTAEQIAALSSAMEDIIKDINDSLKTCEDHVQSAHAPANAEENVIVSIQRNGQAIPPDNKVVNIEVPTKTSALENDSGYATTEDVEEKVNGAGHLKAVPVDALPAPSEANADTIYFLRKNNSEAGKQYRAYKLIHGIFEIVGSAEVDLTSYATTEDVEEKVNGAGHLKAVPVDALPAPSEANADTIYFLRKNNSEAGKQYRAYKLIHGIFEIVGSAEVDLTSYATRESVAKADDGLIKGIYNNMTASSEKYLGSGNLLLFWTLLKSLLNGHESSINDLLARVKLLELILSADVTGNPYYVTFNTLTDVVVSSGIWNKSDGRIEF